MELFRVGDIRFDRRAEPVALLSLLVRLSTQSQFPTTVCHQIERRSLIALVFAWKYRGGTPDLVRAMARTT